MVLATYEGMLAETVRMKGHNGDEIDAYLARPLGPGPFPAVVLIHHLPGWDEASKEMMRKFAYNGFICIGPHLHHREGPGSIDDITAAVRAGGGCPDDRMLGDVQGAMDYVKSLPYHNGKIGSIGFCSGGRQSYIVACNLDMDAAVDCWGGRVVAAPQDLTPRQPVAPIDMTKDLKCPLLGIFGEEDTAPSPAQVAQHEAELKKHNKNYEFHTFKNAGHGIFAVDRPSYRQAAAVEGWKLVFQFYNKYLR
jgi:carboxymethylenebutenolidase